MVDAYGRVRGAGVGGAVQRGEAGEGPQHLPDLLHRDELGGLAAALVDRGAVVVRGVDDGCGQPPPGGAAERHVHVVEPDAVGEVRQVEAALVGGVAGTARLGVPQAAELGAAPRVEPAAAELGEESRGAGARGGAALGAAGAEAAPVRRVPGRGGVAVEGVEVAAGLPAGGEAARDPVAVASLVVVEQRHLDAVGADLGVQVGEVGGAGAVGEVRGVLVLQLVEQHGALPAGVLVAGDDRVDGGQPLVDVAEVRGVVGARLPGGRGQPARVAAGVHLGVDVRARAHGHVQPGLGGHPQEQVQVADAGEVVRAGGGGVVVPRDVDADGVVAVRAELLQHVAPERRAGQPEGVELAGPQHDPAAVDDQRVGVERHGVPGAAGAGRRAARGGRGHPRCGYCASGRGARGEEARRQAASGESGEASAAEVHERLPRGRGTAGDPGRSRGTAGGGGGAAPGRRLPVRRRTRAARPNTRAERW